MRPKIKDRRCRTFPWDSQDTSLEDFYRSLMTLRHDQPALASTQVKPLILNDKHRVFAYLRGDPTSTNPVVVAVNDETKPRTVKIPLKGSPVTTWAGNDGKTYKVANGSVSVRLGKYGAIVLTSAAS
ncbi:MAG TPA: hypothetical protein VFA78_00105 [Chloroflexota bacterium]|nr:hypothetical protein [Chloroflexota bacterium]